MRPTTAPHRQNIDPEFDALVHSRHLSSSTPAMSLRTPALSLSEKRAILASWASDASAIASCPALRAPEGLKNPVTIDEILEALSELDRGPQHPPGGKPMRLRSIERMAA